MTYLKNGETYRSRLEDLLVDVRYLPTNAAATREKARDEAALLIALIHADAAEALVSAELNLMPRARGAFEAPPADLVSVDDAVAALEVVLDSEGRGIDGHHRALFLRHLTGEEREEPTVGDADREGPPYSFTPDAFRSLKDTLALDVKDGEPTPHLPGEQDPANDPEPAVDFEMEIDVTADTLDDLGKRSDLDDLDPTDDLDDDPDLADFRPASTGKPASPPETPLQKAKKANAKKETKK